MKGEGRKNKLVECAMCRCVSVRAHVRVSEESALSGGGLADNFLEEVGKKNAKQERFRKEQGAFLSVMLITYRESPPTKGSSPLLERVFVVLKITLTRSKNAPNHQINKQKNNRKGGNLKRPPLC